MADNIKITQTIVLAVLALVMAGFLAIQTASLVWMATQINEEENLESLRMSGYIDEQIDAGFASPDLDPDDPLLRDRVIFLGHSVNSRSAKDVTRKLLFLNSLDSQGPIDLYISTQGGYEDSAFTIIDTIESITAPVNTLALGGCYSAGTMILAAGTGVRSASRNAIIMVHANAFDSQEPFSIEMKSNRRYERLWREKTDLPEDWFPMTRDEAYYLTPEEAVEMGIIDEVSVAEASN